MISKVYALVQDMDSREVGIFRHKGLIKTQIDCAFDCQEYNLQSPS